MDDGGTLEAILRGTGQDENKTDVLHLCLSAVTAKLSTRGEPESAAEFYDQLKLIGEILCPIFTPVKPPDYVEEMTNMRRDYRGIASDPEMQRAFAIAALDAARQGLLESVEVAVEARLWRYLGLGQIV